MCNALNVGGDSYFVCLDTSRFICLHVSTIFFGLWSSSASGLLSDSQGTLALQAPWKVSPFVVPPQILIHMLGRD